MNGLNQLQKYIKEQELTGVVLIDPIIYIILLVLQVPQDLLLSHKIKLS